MMARHHLSSEFTPEPNRHQSLVQMLKYSCSLIKRAVKVCSIGYSTHTYAFNPVLANRIWQGNQI